MTNKLPDSLEIEINKFLEGFKPKTILFNEEGLKELGNYYQKVQERDDALFKIKHHLSEAIRINLQTKK